MKGGAALFVGFEGTRLSADERRILRRLGPAGVTLVPRNIEDARQLGELVAELRRLCAGAVLALDAEGGRVDRLRRIVAPAPAAAQLALRGAAASRSAGRWVGGALRRFGFDLDLAPVVDLDRGEIDNALDGRCFGRTARAVIARARAFLDGLHVAGVGGCLKHFPGLGGARRDTHADPAWIGLSRQDLRDDLRPFRALASGAEAVMASHAVYPALDAAALPTTLSPALATALLRRELGYRGVLLSDDLEMGALAPHGDLVERGEAALAAGCDGLLFCRRIDQTPAIAERLERPHNRRRLASATARLVRLRRRLARLRKVAGEPPSLAELRRRLAQLAVAAARQP